MMMRLRVIGGTILAGLLLCVGCHSASSDRPPLNADEARAVTEKIPKGLKTKTQLIYSLIDSAGKPEKVLESKEIRTYDDKGNQIEMDVYDGDGTLTEKRLCKHDDKGRVVEETIENPGSKPRKVLSKYDDRGNRVEEAYSYEGGGKARIVHKYDDNRRLVEDDQYREDGELADKTVLKYDDKGNVIETDYHVGHAKLNEQKTLCRYDDKGNRAEEAYYMNYSGEWELQSKDLYKRDDKGKVVERVWCEYKDKKDGTRVEDKRSTRKETIERKYDDKGNEIEETSSSYRLIPKDDWGAEEERKTAETQVVWEYEFYPESGKDNSK